MIFQNLDASQSQIFVFKTMLQYIRKFLVGSDGKESACNTRDPGLIPWLGRLPGEGNGHPLQHSCLENSMDRGAWRATVHGVTKSQTRPELLTHFQDINLIFSNIGLVEFVQRIPVWGYGSDSGVFSCSLLSSVQKRSPFAVCRAVPYSCTVPSTSDDRQ